MIKIEKFLFALLCCLCFSFQTITAQTPKTFKFINGNWFDGKDFKRTVFYSVNGVFVQKRPAQIDQTIDLKNGFVVPPFADAHCHHFDGAYNVAEQIAMYLRDGVFYAKVQTDVRSGALAVADKVNKPISVDVSYAHGALTHTYGHGIEIYEGLALGFYGDMQKYNDNIAKIAASRIRNDDAYYIIDTAEDLDKKWPQIIEGKPDFLKIYLLHSEDFAEKQKNIPNIRLGSIGLDPKLVPTIVQKAHAAGLRVSAHIDTVTDYRIALNGGVDEMAHMPGYYVGLDEQSSKYLLTDKDAQDAARRGLWIIPAPLFNQTTSEKERKKTDAVLLNNFRLLKKYWVKIAFGSDRYGSTPLDDVFYVANLGVFNNRELLKIWCQNTPQTIFPNRKIGFLRAGYEASFVVLENNPLADFTAVKNISFRFKQGFVIELAKT